MNDCGIQLESMRLKLLLKWLEEVKFQPYFALPIEVSKFPIRLAAFYGVPIAVTRAK